MDDDAGRGESRESIVASVGIGSDFELGIPESVRGGDGGWSSIGGRSELSTDIRGLMREGGRGVTSLANSGGGRGNGPLAVADVEVL